MFSALFVRTIHLTELFFKPFVFPPVTTLLAIHVQDKIAYDESR